MTTNGDSPGTPDSPFTVLALAGSYRTGSYNQALIRAAREAAPAHVALESFDLRSVPHYDGDLESAGDPDVVVALKRAVLDADALLVATPEYNGGLPGVLKNGIDWTSRKYPDAPIRGKLSAVVGASPGRGGTRTAQEHLRKVLERVGAIVVEPTIMVARAGELIAEGEVVSAELRQQLGALMENVADTIHECMVSGSSALAVP